MNMKIDILVIFLILITPLSAFGDEKVELAKEIMELTNVKEMMKQVKANSLQMQNQLMDQFDVPEDKDEKAIEFKKKVHDKIFEIMGFETMENEYIDLITSVYSIGELRGIVEFYKSPIGKSMLEKQPIIINKSMAISQDRMQVLIPELQKMSKEFESSLLDE
jgi:hypothetical protein